MRLTGPPEGAGCVAELVDCDLWLNLMRGEGLGDCDCGGETAHSAADDDDFLRWTCHCVACVFGEVDDGRE